MDNYVELNSIKLSGYKSIKNTEIDLRRVNILIGANGSGKSNLISLFKLLNAMTLGTMTNSNHLQNFVMNAGGANSLLHFGYKVTKQIDLEMVFSTQSGKNRYSMSLTRGDKDTLYFLDERIAFTPKQRITEQLMQSIGGGSKESHLNEWTNLPEFQSPIAKTIRNILNKWRFYQFHDTSSSTAMKQTCEISNSQYLAADGGNLAAFLYNVKKRYYHNYEYIVNTIREVAPFFDDFVLEVENNKYILLRWRNRNSKLQEYIFSADQLSDGTLRFIALTALLLQPKLPSMIVIDEPELGLHPMAINILSSLIKDAATKTQVLISTQSVELINYFSLDDIIVVDLYDGQTKFTRPNANQFEHWMKEYTLGDLWKANIIGGRPSK